MKEVEASLISSISLPTVIAIIRNDSRGNKQEKLHFINNYEVIFILPPQV
jgi:hypothetical protein